MKNAIQLSLFFVTGIKTIAGGWVPHVPPPESPYEMTLSLVNESDRVQVIHFFPYDAHGVELAPFKVAIQPHTFQTHSAASFLDAFTSHVRVGSTVGQVRWSYELKGQGPGQPLFGLHSGATYRTQCDWRHGVEGAFGLALVNTTDSIAIVELRFQIEGKVIRSLPMEIEPRGKALLRQSEFSAYEQLVLDIESDQRLAITAAQRSWSGSNSQFFPRDLLLEQTVRSQDLVAISDSVLTRTGYLRFQYHPHARSIRRSNRTQFQWNPTDVITHSNQEIDEPG